MSQANAGDPRGVLRNVPQNLRGTCQGRLPSWRSDQRTPESAGHFRESHVPGVLARCSPGAFARSASLGGGLREVLHAVLTYATISRMMPMRDNEHSQYQTVLPGDTGAPEYGELQHLVDGLFEDDPKRLVSKIDVLVRADIEGICGDLREVVDLLPGGRYTRRRLCDQMNSIITAHGWGYSYGTVY